MERSQVTVGGHEIGSQEAIRQTSDNLSSTIVLLGGRNVNNEKKHKNVLTGDCHPSLLGVIHLMRVLVACESSGVVRDAFSSKGHDAWSCDLLPAKGNHIQGDATEVLEHGWDLLIAHPPCTYLSASGMHWTTRGLRDPKLTDDAMELVKAFVNAPIAKICVENSVGVISTRYKKPDQYIQPYFFGEDASKKTGLWLKNLPKLRNTAFVEPRMVKGMPRWANQTDSGQNRLPPSKNRWQKRSQTYKGIAEAMADQWGQESVASSECLLASAIMP